MQRFIATALLACGLVAAAFAQSTPVDGIDRVIDSAIQSRAFAGAVVGVATNGRVDFIKGYGLADLEQRTAMTERTVLRIGSVTKQFTAALVLRLVDQGKLALDDTLSRYVPDFPRGGEVRPSTVTGCSSACLMAASPWGTAARSSDSTPGWRHFRTTR
jgi:CubicO group peptidase (beta-lactamase class C family)